MARRRWYRRSVRVVAAKKKWASNMQMGTITVSSVLVENAPARTIAGATAPTPVILKCGNFKIQGDVAVTGSGSAVVRADIFLLYVPEGVATDTALGLHNLVLNHPEWILAWTALDTPMAGSGTVNGNKFSMTTRLKRNLNSGDRIFLFLDNRNDSFTVQADFTAQFFTCVN